MLEEYRAGSVALEAIIGRCDHNKVPSSVRVQPESIGAITPMAKTVIDVVDARKAIVTLLNLIAPNCCFAQRRPMRQALYTTWRTSMYSARKPASQ